ncbi:MAG: tetratricopeptide repeat protein [Candidatus Syntrophosphaera sp.]|nr:tetratricopeptide repeat protein [Candidatus Syntrophosphaera sp.]
MLAEKELQNLLLRAGALMKTNWIYAVQLLNKAAEENPEDPRPLIALGDFYQERQLFNKAVKYYQSALKLNPDDDRLKLIIGNTLFSEGEYQLAIVYYDQIDDQTVDVRYNKALALAYLGRNRESINIMRDLLDLIDNNPFIYFLLIEQLMHIEEFEEAQKYIQRAEKRIGEHRHLMLLKALIYAHFQNWLLAYNAFYNYEQSGDIVQSEHIYIYADCAVKSGMSNRAIQILEKGIDDNPYSIPLYEELIRLLIQQNRITKARHYMQEAKHHFNVLSPLLQLMDARLNRM